MIKPYLLLLFFLGSINLGFAQEVYQAHAHVQLVSEQDAIVPGKIFWVGIDFLLDDGWHIYWKNPGDAGLAPKIKWDLPPGVKAGDIQWPNPKRFKEGPSTSFGYEHEVLLLVPISVDRDLISSQNVNLQAHLDWLACYDMCMPGRAELNLSLPVASENSEVTYNNFKTLFDHTRHNLPQSIPLWLACLFAAIGGLILNLMPCVLPVLSIKVFHLVERHPDRKIAFRHSLVYALGILVSVWALALLLFILKSAGEFVGWGFQFQSPIFVIVVALILLVLALNLFGLFEFSIPNIIGLPVSSKGYGPSFISGVITTIVASPCTAPLMGAALTVAISQPNIVGFGIFTFLGLGVGLTICAVECFSNSIIICSEAWTMDDNLKRVLGVILLACVFWLLWVFGIQTGIGDLSKFYKPTHEIQWQNYSSEAVSQAREKNHGVFIDFTADWCINCQVNDRLILQNVNVVDAFKNQDIIAFKADWTKYNPAVTQALSDLGRNSIPVYVYYPPGTDAPMILPQLITPKVILEYINGRSL